jgi:hypothetical protein
MEFNDDDDNNNFISKSFRKYVNTIPGSHEVRELPYLALHTFFGKC